MKIGSTRSYNLAQRIFSPAILLLLTLSPLLQASSAQAQDFDRIIGEVINKLGSELEKQARRQAAKSRHHQPNSSAVRNRDGSYDSGSTDLPSIDDITLGDKRDEATLKRKFSMSCKPSTTYEQMRWCSASARKRAKRGTFTVRVSALIDESNAIRYLNKQYAPAFFKPGEMKNDIDLLARVTNNDPIVFSDRITQQGPFSKIAVWGRLNLSKLDAGAYNSLRKGNSPKKGLLLDHLNNFKKSAQRGLPVYAMPAGKAYVWIGRNNRRGKGSLRFFLIDADYLAGQLAGRSTRVATWERRAKPHTKLTSRIDNDANSRMQKRTTHVANDTRASPIVTGTVPNSSNQDDATSISDTGKERKFALQNPSPAESTDTRPNMPTASRERSILAAPSRPPLHNSTNQIHYPAKPSERNSNDPKTSTKTTRTVAETTRTIEPSSHSHLQADLRDHANLYRSITTLSLLALMFIATTFIMFRKTEIATARASNLERSNNEKNRSSKTFRPPPIPATYKMKGHNLHVPTPRPSDIEPNGRKLLFSPDADLGMLLDSKLRPISCGEARFNTRKSTFIVKSLLGGQTALYSLDDIIGIIENQIEEKTLLGKTLFRAGIRGIGHSLVSRGPNVGLGSMILDMSYQGAETETRAQASLIFQDGAVINVKGRLDQLVPFLDAIRAANPKIAGQEEHLENFATLCAQLSEDAPRGFAEVSNKIESLVDNASHWQSRSEAGETISERSEARHHFKQTREHIIDLIYAARYSYIDYIKNSGDKAEPQSYIFLDSQFLEEIGLPVFQRRA